MYGNVWWLKKKLFIFTLRFVKNSFVYFINMYILENQFVRLVIIYQQHVYLFNVYFSENYVILYLPLRSYILLIKKIVWQTVNDMTTSHLNESNSVLSKLYAYDFVSIIKTNEFHIITKIAFLTPYKISNIWSWI